MYYMKCSILRDEFYSKIMHIVSTFKQISPLQANDQLMIYVNIHLVKYISSYFDLRNIILLTQTDSTWLLCRNLIISSR